MFGLLTKPAEPQSGGDWQQTIVSVEPELRLRALSIAEDSLGQSNLELERRRFKVRLTRTTDQHLSTNLLVRKMYSWRGYHTTEENHAANRICLSVSSDDHVIGTLTLGLDLGEGLSADQMYHEELDTLRAQGRVVCEITRLAVDQSVGSRRVLAALFHIAYIHARRIQGCTDIVIEVNPRHVMFYQRMLGFRQFGAEKLCDRVNAPAVLLRLETDYVDIQLAKFAGLGENATGERSLYPYAFSKLEEAGITRRLQAQAH